MAALIQLRRDTAANWTTVNPILGQGEYGYETDTAKRKIGDGVTAWTGLAYLFSYFPDQTANTFLAGPSSGVAGVPTFRALTAADLGQDKARAYLAAAFTTTATTQVLVPIDTVSYDTNGLVDLVNYRIVPKKAGYYTVTGRASVGGTAAGQRAFASIALNGAEVARSTDITSSAATPLGGGATDLIYCNGTTDYLSLLIWTNPALGTESFPATCYLSAVGPF